MSKKVLILSGSPRKGGNSDILCDEFLRGAREAGHQVEKVRPTEKKIAPCLGCYYCASHGGECVRRDDMADLLQQMIDADVIVLASPVYFYSINAQLKAVIDRFYANNEVLMGGKKAVLITAMADTEMDSALAANEMFRQMTGYLGWENAGVLNARNAPTAADLSGDDLERAYALGEEL